MRTEKYNLKKLQYNGNFKLRHKYFPVNTILLTAAFVPKDGKAVEPNLKEWAKVKKKRTCK